MKTLNLRKNIYGWNYILTEVNEEIIIKSNDVFGNDPFRPQLHIKKELFKKDSEFKTNLIKNIKIWLRETVLITDNKIINKVERILKSV